MLNAKMLASLGDDMDDVASKAGEKGKEVTERLSERERNEGQETKRSTPPKEMVSLNDSEDEAPKNKSRNDDKQPTKKIKKQAGAERPKTPKRFITVLNNQDPTVPFSSKLTLSSKIKLKEQSLKRQLQGLDYPTQTAILEEALFLFYEKHKTVN